MRIVTRTYIAKNKKGGIQLIREIEDSSESQEIKEELTAELIQQEASKISEENKDEDMLFLSMYNEGEAGRLSRKFLEE